MSGERHNAPIDFDLTGDDGGGIRTSALSVDTPVQQEAPSPRLHEHLAPREELEDDDVDSGSGGQYS